MKFVNTKFLLFSAVASIFSSCTTKETSAPSEVMTTQVSVDSLRSAWDEAWNTQNKDAIMTMLADDAIVFEDGWRVIGKDSLEKRFVIPNSGSIRSFKTTKVTEDVSDEIAYLVGDYTIETNKEPSTTTNGPFTLIWKKQSDNSWKVAVLHTGTVK